MMKPARGSKRAPSNVPQRKNKRKTTKKQEATKCPGQTSGEQNHKEVSLHRKSSHKRKAGGSSSPDARDAKAMASWKPMSKASITVVENIMDLSILETLSSKSTANKEHQEHLNVIKNRFLDVCKELKVPQQKQKALQDSHKSQQVEREKSVTGKKCLSNLEKDLSALARDLERMEEQTVSLQHRCNMLRSQVEEEEEKAKKILEIAEQDVLNLPVYPSQKNETTLEMRTRQLISEKDREPIAKKLAVILQTSEMTQNAQVLLKQARKYADQLFAD